MQEEQRSFAPRKSIPVNGGSVSIPVDTVGRILEFLFDPFQTEQSEVYNELKDLLAHSAEPSWQPIASQPDGGTYLYKARTRGRESVWLAEANSAETAGATLWARVPTDDPAALSRAQAKVTTWVKAHEFDDPVDRATYFIEHLNELEDHSPHI